ADDTHVTFQFITRGGTLVDSYTVNSTGPTATPTPTNCTVCALSVTSATISCNPDGTVHWTGIVHNGSTCTITSSWKANLLGQRGNSLHVLQTQTGTTQFAPGDTNVSDDFCYMPGNISAEKVEFGTNNANTRCNQSLRSSAI